MLFDSHGRIISYLRIGVTDRCNFRCVYCMPADGIALVPKQELLSFEEIARVARVGAGLGLTKVRLTGGEPTVRSELPTLVAMLAAIEGIGEIAMTTNAARLDELAGPLKRAGLARVNISLDTLDAARAAEIARRDVLPAVMRGIDAALAAGLGPLKFNAVVMRGVNDDELPDLVDFARERGAQMRFIEYMPMGDARFDGHSRTVTAGEMLQTLRRRFDLVPEACGDAHGSDPARAWVCQRTGGRVGLITSISDNFCSTCNRMRLTAEGGLRPCLHQDAEVDVREVLRGGGDDEAVADAYRRAAILKWAGHRMTAFVPLYSRKEMVAIGG
jgi:cyclic pyranopterin phosphate synthase